MDRGSTTGHRAGIVAVLTVFALNGVVFGSWASRVPALAAQIGAEEGTLGLSLLGASVGMITAASFSGALAARFGARVLVALSSLGACVIVPVLGAAGSPVAMGVTLVFLGVSVGLLDVAMNIAAVTIERRTGRPLMPVFHAAFSFGGMVGAGGAALAAANELGPQPHLGIVGVVIGVLTLAVVRFVPVESAETRTPQPEHRGTAPIKRPVLWLLAAVALCSAVAEGASADWSALFGVQDRGLGEATAAFVYGGFSVAMAITRLLGERAERRFGPERLLAGGALVAAAGLLVATTIPVPLTAFLGFALAGIGLAYAFPIALSLAGAVGRRADGSGGEREIGFVTAIAYSGFLAGPPLIGGIAHLTSLPVALGIAGLVCAMIAPFALAAAAARRKEQAATAAAAVPEPSR